jgi:hypothetical protein
MSGVDASFVELFEVINRVTGARVSLRTLPPILFRLAARVDTAVAAWRWPPPASPPTLPSGSSATGRIRCDHGRGQLDLAAPRRPRAIRRQRYGRRLTDSPLRAHR